MQGDMCRLVGLIETPELNGKECMVMGRAAGWRALGRQAHAQRFAA